MCINVRVARRRLPRNCFATVLLLFGVYVSNATSQTSDNVSLVEQGLAAFRQGDYSAAATALKAHLFDAYGNADAMASYTLGSMFLDGRGVPQDTVRGCALVAFAESKFGAALHAPEREMAGARSQQSCSGLATEEMFWLRQMTGCFWETPSTVLDLGQLGWISMERRRLQFVSDAGSSVQDLPGVACGVIVLPLVHTRLDLPVTVGSKAATRDFLEYFTWHSSPRGGVRWHTLHWLVCEIHPGRVTSVLSETVYETTDLTYPGPDVPVAFQDVASLRVRPDGEIEWLLNTLEHSRSGILPALQVTVVR